MLIELINDRSARNGEKTTKYIHTIFQASFPSILRSVGLNAGSNTSHFLSSSQNHILSADHD
jgi:hypothetical protein